MNVIHFKSQKERLAFLKGNYEEIVPQEIIPQEAEKIASVSVQEASEAIPKSKKKRASKKKVKKDDEVQAE